MSIEQTFKLEVLEISPSVWCAAGMQAAVRAINNPHRQEILRLVWSREMTSGEIASHFDLTWPTVSFNLKVLREAGLVHERRDGNRRLYKADRKALRAIEHLLRDLWKGNLERIGELAEKEARRRGSRR